MNSEHYEVLQDILKEYQHEVDNIEQQIKENLFAIEKNNTLIAFYKDNEDYGYNIFSPRDTESKEEQAGQEKELFEQKNQSLSQKKDLLYERMEKIQALLSESPSSKKEVKKETNLTVLSIQEEDRQRIARDLHDTSLQNLTHLVHKIELSSLFIDQDPVRAKLELAVVNKKLKTTIEEIRNTIFNLRSMTFDDLGLKAAFERLLEVINEHKQFEIEKKLEDIVCENNLILATIYRVVQEGLNNIQKHSDADKILFHCRQQDTVCIIDIEDNGKGFTQLEIDNKKNRHFGIGVMKERVELLGGQIEINSRLQEGTKIHMKIPLE